MVRLEMQYQMFTQSSYSLVTWFDHTWIGFIIIIHSLRDLIDKSVTLINDLKH